MGAKVGPAFHPYENMVDHGSSLNGCRNESGKQCVVWHLSPGFAGRVETWGGFTQRAGQGRGWHSGSTTGEADPISKYKHKNQTKHQSHPSRISPAAIKDPERIETDRFAQSKNAIDLELIRSVVCADS